MIKTSIEKISRDIGFDIGNSDDQVQANLLNGLGDAFGNYSHQNAHTQICYVSDKLNQNAINLIKLLHEYVKDK